MIYSDGTGLTGSLKGIICSQIGHHYFAQANKNVKIFSASNIGLFITRLSHDHVNTVSGAFGTILRKN